jgi:broad-specificity NMP kinase
VTGFPVLWICGAPGAGKSVAAWRLFEQLTADRCRAAYVDIDQLGMLYPAAESDSERHLLKAEALAALVPGYVAAGAQVLVVSGVIDPESGPTLARSPDVDFTLCLLAPEAAAIRERIRARGWGEDEVDAALADNAELRGAAFVDNVIETGELSVADTVKRLRSLVIALGSSCDQSSLAVTSAADLDVVVVTGARAAGSSTIGFGLADRRWRAGLSTGFLDLQQLGFIAGTSDVTLALSQLSAMHGLFSAHGAESLVVSGHLGIPDRARIRTALPSARVVIVRLRADPDTFEAHVCDRVAGSAARLAGDDLLGADRQHQAAVLANALAEQQRLDAVAVDDVTFDVTDHSVDDSIAALEHLVAAHGTAL